MVGRKRTATEHWLLALAVGTIAALLSGGTVIHAQDPEGLDGTWEGVLVAGPNKLRLVLEVSKSSDGIYLGTLVSVDQGGARIPIDRIDGDGDKVRLEMRAVKASFEGTMNADKTRILGAFTQGQPLPLEFVRTAEATKSEPAADSTARVSNPFGVPLDLQVPFAPVPFAGGGEQHLVYELHITNFGGAEALLSRIEVLGEDATLASFEGSELNALLARPGTPGLQDKRSIGPGLRAAAYLWVTVEEGAAVPASLRHRIISGSETVEGGAVTVAAGKPIVLGPPLRGSDWRAVNGPSNDSIHRRALFPVEGKARIAQRLAIDWLRLGPDQKSFAGDRKVNKNYHAYGQEVLAAANAVVVATKDGIPENEPGPTSRAVPMTLETLGGNSIVLDLGGGRYAFYAHLQPESLRVKVGEKVSRGQVLGLLGNSGNSTEPHLHFHVSDGQSLLGSEGISYVLDSFELLSGAHPGRRENQLPLQNDRVSFAESR